MDIAKKIVWLRKTKGMTQDELAEILKVSRQTISKWENGSVMPDAYNLKELAKVFETTIDELLSDDPPDEAPKSQGVVEDVIDQSGKIIKKHWRKVGYIIIYWGIGALLFGVIASLMIEPTITDPFTGQTIPFGDSSGTVGKAFDLLPKVFIFVGIALIIVGAILAIKDYLKNHHKKS